MAVEPFTSQKRMVTVRLSLPTWPRVASSRSAYSMGARRLSTPAAVASVSFTASAAAVPVAAPQLKQNLA